MLPYGWIPEDGAEFSQQFIDNLKLIWLQLCDSTKEHLSTKLLTPVEVIYHSEHQNDCQPTTGMSLLFDYLYQQNILIQATAAPQDNLFGAISRHYTSKDIVLSYNRYPAIVTACGVECYFKQESRQLRRI